jgi:small-conductance mechanosensitive channel
MSVSALLAQSTTTIPENPAAQVIQSLTNLDQACGDQPSWACELIYDWTGSDTWAGIADWILAKPIAILVILGVAGVVTRIARFLVKRFMVRITTPASSERLHRLRARTPNVLLRTEEWNLRSEARSQTLTAVIRSIVSICIWFVALVAILGVLEINIGPLIAGAGIAGIALGFGTQAMVRDFIAGFFLVVEDQFGVGDVVDLGGDAKGTVEKVTLRATRLRDSAGIVWHVPNGQIQRVGNKSQEWARALLDVVVGYDADIPRVKEVVRRTAQELTADPLWAPEVLEEPDMWGVEAMGAEGITIRVGIKTRPASQFAVLRALRERLKAAFDAEGLSFAAAGGPSEVIVRQVGVEPTSEPPAGRGRAPGGPAGSAGTSEPTDQGGSAPAPE